MKCRTNITFRGEDLEVDIFYYEEDPSTNSTTLEWDFVGLTNAGRNLLKLTQEEEEKIEQYLVLVMADRQQDFGD